LALFAGAGFLLFALNDLLVDLIYFARRIWRALTVQSRYPRAFASDMPVQVGARLHGRAGAGLG
jgi:adsorption protein B